MTSTAVIEIIGIVLVSLQIVPQHLVAVAPRIPCPAASLQRRADSTVKAGDVAITAQTEMRNTGVTEHVALLLIKTGNFSLSGTWTPASTTLNWSGESYFYFKLDGEEIRFKTDTSE